MKKTFKIRMITVMALATCLSLVLGVSLIFGTSAKVNATTPSTFSMLGVSIRYTNAAGSDDGIRFGVTLDKTTYNTLKNDGNAEAGILITPTDKVTGDPLSLATWETYSAKKGILFSASESVNNWVIGEDDDYATGIVYLHGFPSASFNRPITARGYIDWDGNGSDVNYTTTVTKSMSDVALAVRDDYEGSNTYSTTKDHYNKLDAYLLEYEVKFVDDLGGTVETQNVKYGSDFVAPTTDPENRYGYTFNDDWFEKNGSNSYESTATDFSDKTVKYARTFKAGYDIVEDSPAYEKPILDTSSATYTTAYTSSAQNSSWLRINNAGYLFKDVTIPYGDYNNDAPDKEYAVTATFKPIASGDSIVYPKVGFTFSGANGKHLEVAYDAYRKQIRVYQYGDDTKTRRYPIAVDAPYEQGTAIAEDARITLTIVYRNPKFFDVYINGEFACEINLRYQYKTNSNDNEHSTEKHCASIGTGSALKVGLSVDNGSAYFYDYGYRTFDTYQNAINLQSGATIDSFCCDLSNKTNFPASGTGKNPQFEVSATAPQNSLIKYAYFSFSAANGQALHIGYNVATSRVRVQSGTLFREYAIKTGDGYSNGYNGETANVFRLTYDGSVNFRMYINGKEAYLTDGYEGKINMRYDFTGNNSSGGSTYAWACFAGSSAGTSGKTLGVGFSYTVPVDEYDFAYSTDGDYTVASEVTLKLPKVANFKSNVGGTTDDEKAKYSANLSEFGNNSPFTVTATLDADHATGTDFIGFTFSAYGKMLKVGYNKETSRVRVEVSGKYREYTISTNGYNSSTANTFKLYYNGGAEMQLYINGVEAVLSNGNGGSICLRYGMSGNNSSGDESVKAWHGFAGSSEAEGNARSLYIGTFGEGMTFNDISLEYIDVASFKSNVSSSGDFPAGGTGSNNPTFDVTATLDADHATGTDYVGFILVTKGTGLKVGYNKATNRVRVQIGSDFIEYTIVKNGYDASGANTFRLTYNGGATLRLYINGKEAEIATSGNGAGFGVNEVGTINLRYGMRTEGGEAYSSNNNNLKAWHGFAGSGETAGVTRTLHIGTFGDGMSLATFTEQ